MNSGLHKLSEIIKKARLVLGLALLAFVIAWVVRDGDVIQRISVGLLVSATVVAVLLCCLNTLILFHLSRAYGGELDYKQSLHITALGSFANAAGGLPIGTGLKYLLLHKQGKISVAQTTVGLLVYTAFISLALLAYLGVSIWWVDTSIPKLLPTVIFAVAAIALYGGLRAAAKIPQIDSLLTPLTSKKNLPRVVVVSGAVAAGFLSSYWVVASYLLSTLGFAELVFMCSLALLIGQAALLQSVGGTQEILVGLTAKFTGLQILDGVLMGLVTRLATLIACGLILAVIYLGVKPRNQST